MISKPLGRLMSAVCAAVLTVNVLPYYEAAGADEEEPELLYQEIPVTSFRVSEIAPQILTDADYTDWWYSEWDDCRYLFLPATADRSKLTVTYNLKNSTDTLTLNGQTLKSGQSTALFSEADVFEIEISGKSFGELHVMQSELGAIYLSTSKGTLDYLDTHSSYEESGSALMLTANGAVTYQGEIEKLKRHGNSSWDYSDKKPYNLKLPEKANLYGMGKAKKWVLLGNYLDHSMLRNKATLEMGRQAGMEYTMDSVFVDLYADGDYRGTYQLYEKVQIQKNRVNITDLEELTEKLNEKDLDEYEHIAVGAGLKEYKENSYKYYDIPNNPADITGGYLLQFQLYNRYGSKADSGFITSRGQAVQIDGPEYASKAQVEYIRTFMQDLEDAIYSSTGYNKKGKHYTDYIDVDSLVLAYLVQEIAMNPDGTHTSFYLWKDSDSKGDGKLHCSPVWDFDLAYYNYAVSRSNSYGDIGYAGRPDLLYAAYFAISGYDSEIGDGKGSENPNVVGVTWVGELYHSHPEFVQRAAELYYERFDSNLEELTDTSQENGCLLQQWADEMAASSAMNLLRWHMYGGKPWKRLGPVNGNTYAECLEFLRYRIAVRMVNLREIWLPQHKTTLAAKLTEAVEAIDDSQYDTDGISELRKLADEAYDAIQDAGTYAAAEEALSAGTESLLTVPHKEISGDFDDSKTVDLDDAQSLLRYYARQLALFDEAVTPTQFRNGDMDKDGKITAVDAMLILRAVTLSGIGA